MNLFAKKDDDSYAGQGNAATPPTTIASDIEIE